MLFRIAHCPLPSAHMYDRDWRLAAGCEFVCDNRNCTDPFWTAPLTLMSTMSPTLYENFRQISNSCFVHAGFEGFMRTGRSSGRWRDGSYRAP
jgi:hypothetical protein